LSLLTEVTKVRRNLFNEGIRSPSKRTTKKMPRSQSVSAVEGLRYKCTDEGAKGRMWLACV